MSQGHLERAEDITSHMFPLAHVKRRPLEAEHFETLIIFYLLFIIFEIVIYLLLSTVDQGLGTCFV